VNDEYGTDVSKFMNRKDLTDGWKEQHDVTYIIPSDDDVNSLSHLKIKNLQLPPKFATAKGRPKIKRNKHPNEFFKKKKYQCSICFSRGHTKATCSQTIQTNEDDRPSSSNSDSSLEDSSSSDSESSSNCSSESSEDSDVTKDEIKDYMGLIESDDEIEVHGGSVAGVKNNITDAITMPHTYDELFKYLSNISNTEDHRNEPIQSKALLQLLQIIKKEEIPKICKAWTHKASDIVTTLLAGAGGSTVDLLGRHFWR
jgi:hypothetical protein